MAAGVSLAASDGPTRSRDVTSLARHRLDVRVDPFVLVQIGNVAIRASDSPGRFQPASKPGEQTSFGLAARQVSEQPDGGRGQ